MKNPFLKNLEEQELIREATRKGISVDELKLIKSQPVEPLDLSSLLNPVQDYQNNVELGPMTASLESGMMRIPQISNIKKGLPKKDIEEIKEEPKSFDEEKRQVVNEYIKKSYGTSKYSDDERQKILDQNKKDASGPNWLAALAGLGGTLQGKDALSSGMKVLDLQEQKRQSKVDEFDQGRKQSIEQMKIDKDMQVSDPNSAQSQSFRKVIEANFPKIAQAYGDSWNNVSAADKELIFEPIKLREQIEGRKEQARILSQQREDNKEQRNYEKNQLLQTPFGTANSPDDAKQLKSAYEAKMNFDNKLNQLIKIREDAGGGQILDRDTVSRAQQLSNDLLLAYKDMSKLGVLSDKDTKILNEIIPQDPTEYRSPLAFVTGSDPVLAKLKGFKSDTELDFKNKIATRTKLGTDNLQNTKDPLKQQTSTSSEIDSKLNSFMKKNGINDKNEAIKILKEAGKI